MQRTALSMVCSIAVAAADEEIGTPAVADDHVLVAVRINGLDPAMRDPPTRPRASVALLSLEGLALVIGRGNCPSGPLQSRLGDPVPMFQLFLPLRAARAAVPVLVGLSLLGLVAVLGRARASAASARS